jgi:hypothetical protein
VLEVRPKMSVCSAPAPAIIDVRGILDITDSLLVLPPRAPRPPPAPGPDPPVAARAADTSQEGRCE